MKAVFNNKLYDTEKAEELLPQPLLGAALYRASKGSWFLYRIAEFGGAEGIQPITNDQAKALMASHTRYAEFFGEPEEA